MWRATKKKRVGGNNSASSSLIFRVNLLMVLSHSSRSCDRSGHAAPVATPTRMGKNHEQVNPEDQGRTGRVVPTDPFLFRRSPHRRVDSRIDEQTQRYPPPYF